MKRSISSMNNSRDAIAPRLKRTRSRTPMVEGKENMDADIDIGVVTKKLQRNASDQDRRKSYNDENILEVEPTITPSISTISVSKKAALSISRDRRNLVDNEPSSHSQQPVSAASNIRSKNLSMVSRAR